jgi:hypothetical protein
LLGLTEVLLRDSASGNLDRVKTLSEGLHNIECKLEDSVSKGIILTLLRETEVLVHNIPSRNLEKMVRTRVGWKEVLWELYFGGPLHQAGLAERLDLERSSIKEKLDKMENARLVVSYGENGKKIYRMSYDGVLIARKLFESSVPTNRIRELILKTHQSLSDLQDPDSGDIIIYEYAKHWGASPMAIRQIRDALLRVIREVAIGVPPEAYPVEIAGNTNNFAGPLIVGKTLFADSSKKTQNLNAIYEIKTTKTLYLTDSIDSVLKALNKGSLKSGDKNASQ